MKKGIGILLLAFLISAMFSMTVGAETNTSSGFYNIGSKENVVITPYASNNRVTSSLQDVDNDGNSDTFYENSDRLEVSYKAATNGGYYGVLLIEGSELPTKDNKIIYIDQLIAESNTVDFNVYPTLPKNATPLSLYISSNLEDFELIKVPLNYYLPTLPYVLGDVNGDDEWNVLDALMTLQIGAGLRTANEQELLSADVNKDSNCNVLDALMILQYGAGLRTSWE